ncbi:hypothetical protein PHLCEN_2v9526 [Hermanssonia centrifuga]|uniref:Uncharacterized protein n=1 Tax=Hermanssonia centrifuga TaxID=98765 RepID=A0A2R6NQI0_9APHY|nr:hypothetical protein PHLCEN_2v9526 [Hermanssonia centrifuga]
MPGEDLGIPELFHMEREMSEHVRHIGGLLPLTDEQSEALGAAVILLAQGDTDSQLGPPAHYRGDYNDHRHDHGGMYS